MRLVPERNPFAAPRGRGAAGMRWVVLFTVVLHWAASSRLPSPGRGGDGPKRGQVSTRVVSGNTVKANGAIRHPYMASIVKGNAHHCTGVLIKSNVVLTAAHCVDPRRNSPSQLSVRFFRRKGKMTTQETKRVSKIKMHPKYRGQGAGFNLALVKLASSPSLAQPIQFRDEKEVVVKPSETLTYLGWGRTSQSSGSASQLQKARLPVLEEDRCSQQLGGKPIRPSEFCAGSEGQGPCAGDDGGPLLRKGKDTKSDVLVGIATSQLACGSFGKPDVFSRISEYRPWMISEADKL